MYFQASYNEQEPTVIAKYRKQEDRESAVVLSDVASISWFSGSCSLLGISKLSLPQSLMIVLHY